jgi:hypothetical protein
MFWHLLDQASKQLGLLFWQLLLASLHVSHLLSVSDWQWRPSTPAISSLESTANIVYRVWRVLLAEDAQTTRVCAGIFAAQGIGFFFAAAATAVSGNITRALGAQAATGVTVGILLGLTMFLSLVMWRFRSVQVIPNGAFGSRGGGSLDAKADQDWKPVVIGNPSGKMRRMNLLELGSFSRWTEIRKLNNLPTGGRKR